MTKNSPHSALTIRYEDKHIEEALSLKFLGMQLDNHLNWKDHIDQVLPKLSAACYVVRQMHHICDENTLKINLLCLLSFCYKVWNNLSGKFLQQQEGSYFAKEGEVR